MRILLLEDEELSAKRVEKLIRAYDPEWKIISTLESVEETEEWLNVNEAPDLILMDIHLSDGLSFRLFEKIKIESPIIFITAYDQYAIQAFKTNSIDYLLKPLDKTELFAAFDKFLELRNKNLPAKAYDYTELAQDIQKLSKKYKNRFLVKYGDTILFKNIEEVSYFYADEKVVYIVTTDSKKFLVDYNLEDLEEILDPHVFYRINRKFVVKIEAIQKVKTLFNSRLQVFLKPNFESEIYVSRERSQLFKAWIDG
jgi:two-component system, LytTR family, response regulator LytT